jgi:hypothetical protein
MYCSFSRYFLIPYDEIIELEREKEKEYEQKTEKIFSQEKEKRKGKGSVEVGDRLNPFQSPVSDVSNLKEEKSKLTRENVWFRSKYFIPFFFPFTIFFFHSS